MEGCEIAQRGRLMTSSHDDELYKLRKTVKTHLFDI